MINGDRHHIGWRRRALAGIAVAGLLAACTPDSGGGPGGGSSTAEPPPSAAPAKHFGPDGFGTITVGISEQAALAGGELQTAPVSTVLGKNVYSFVGGPAPDPARMAEDEKIEKAVEDAEKNTGTSAADAADAAAAYADSTQRISDRLVAFLDAGGAAFRDGTLAVVAAPKDATTAEGIRRGSTLAELQAAYGAGLTKSSDVTYELAAAGHDGWSLLFELEGDTVRFMSLGRSA